MINKIVSLFMVFCLSLPSTYGNPLVEQEEQPGFNVETPMVWKAEQKELLVGTHRLKVWILPVKNMTAPIGGYLLTRGDFRELKRTIDSLNAEVGRVIKIERDRCDTSLQQKDEDCKRITSDCLAKLDTYKLTQEDLVTKLEHEQFINSVMLWGGGTVILALTTVIVVMSVK